MRKVLIVLSATQVLGSFGYKNSLGSKIGFIVHLVRSSDQGILSIRVNHFFIKKEVVLMKGITFLIIISLSLTPLFGTPIMSLATEDISISYAEDFEISELFICTSNLTQEIFTLNAEQNIARRGLQGCCSHHDGVCDCKYGRVVCCDGTFSPTCTCHHDTIPTKR